MALADEILADVPTVVRRKTWWDDLPNDAAVELTEVRKRFQAGEYGHTKRTTLARLLFDRCRERGWRTCDITRLSQWLAKND